MQLKLKTFLIWFLVFAISLSISFLLINNVIELPFHDKARDVIGFNSSDQAIDAQGNIINNWQSNNLLDDTIKGLVVLVALYAYWKLLSVYISKIWIRLLLGVIGIGIIIVGAYILSFALYWKF